ncbi:MAG: OB-fold nucleic acid binding domain-containing protein [archaeon]
MLRDVWVIRIALGCAICGLIILSIYSETGGCIHKNNGEITNELIGQKVLLFGRITEVKQSASSINFTLFDGNYIKAIMFNPKKEYFAIIQEGDFANICGVVSKYKGKIEIIVEGLEIV